MLPPRSPTPVQKSSVEISEALRVSVHALLDCSACHAPSAGDDASKLGAASCKGGACHAEQNRAFERTVHATVKDQAGAAVAGCADCHGAHDIRPADDPSSEVFPSRLPFTCGKCHGSPELARKLGIREPDAGRRYVDSIHGRRLLTSGLLVAPSCADCHGRAHNIFQAKDPRSTVSRKNVAATCGACHTTPLSDYSKSSHAKALLKGESSASHGAEGDASKVKQGPTCPTCHSAHSIVGPGRGFRLESDRLCGECHEDRIEGYLATYHGRAHRLGDEFVAACHDCHGHHEVRPISDPRSTLSTKNRLETCRKCHAGAPPNFAQFMAHADHSDRENYPGLYWAFVAMTGLVAGTFGFFGLHSLLWLGRSLMVRARDKAGFARHKAAIRREAGAKLYRRFGPVDRFCHFLVIVSFFLLVVTGMPIKFASAPWARAFFDLIGGPSVAASIHRFAAILTLSYFVIHIVSLLVRVKKRRADYRDARGRLELRKLVGLVFGPDSPLPRLQDARDLLAHLRWFLGRGPKPKFDRFTYWEKFDYLAVFWGITVIGISGLVLWFPATFTRILPGWSINLAQLIHSDEALLAAGFIFVFHFFNSHLRPDKWPLDSVMFSGRVTEAEMQHEHPAQYERLAAEGRLADWEFRDEWDEWKWLFNSLGAVAILFGIALAVAIFWSLL